MTTVEVPKLDKFLEKFKEDNKYIIRRYLRDKKRRIVGVLVAFKIGEDVKIGWSKCKIKCDIFDKKVGFYIAVKRAEKKSLDLVTWDDVSYQREFLMGVPGVVKQTMPEFVMRIKRYYKITPPILYPLEVV